MIRKTTRKTIRKTIRQRFNRLSRVLIFSLTGLSGAMGLAQEQPPVVDPAQAVSNEAEKASSEQQAPPNESAPPLIYSPTLDQPEIKELGGNGSRFADSLGLFRWGPVAVRSAEALYNYSSANPGGGTPGDVSAAAFQANVAYTRRLRRSRLVLQYNPRILMVNDQVTLAAANQDSAIDLLFAPAPHLTIGLSDAFNYFGSVQTFNDRTLNSNSLSGAVSNPFLNTQQRTLLNSFAVPINYNLSARSGLLISPLFNYVRTSENKDALPASGQPAVLSLFQYGVRTQLTHAFSPNQSLGLFYNYQMDEQTGIEGNTVFHSFGVTVSRRLGRSLIINGDAGGSRSFRPQSATWTAVGSASLTQAFRRGSLQAGYGRDENFTGFLGSNYNSRVWTAFNEQVGRRMSVSAGGGYLNDSSGERKTTGEYVNNRIDFRLTSTVVWSVGYVHLWQSGHGPQSSNGKQTQVQGGLRWTPLLRPGN